MKNTFYVGEIKSFFADVDGKDTEMILVTRLDQIITTHGGMDYTTTHERLVREDKEFAVYPCGPYVVAIDPAALSEFWSAK